MTAYYHSRVTQITPPRHSVGVTHATSSAGGPISLPQGSEICGFDPSDTPAYMTPPGFVPIEQLPGESPSAGIAKDIVGTEPLSVTVLAPASGTSLSSESVDVYGSFSGPTNTGISVNGQIPAVTVGNSFLAANVPLDPSIAALDVTATTLPGENFSTSVPFLVTNQAPAVARLDVVAGSASTTFAPATITFEMNIGALPNGATVQSVVLDFDGDGITDYTGPVDAAPTTFTYLNAGFYEATLKVTDSNNLVSYARRRVALRDLVAERSMLCDVHAYLRDRLLSNDASGAANAFAPLVYQQYLSFFQSLGANAPDLAGQLGLVTSGYITPADAYMSMVRDNDDQTRSAFPLHVGKNDDGVWRILGM